MRVLQSGDMTFNQVFVVTKHHIKCFSCIMPQEKRSFCVVNDCQMNYQ